MQTGKPCGQAGPEEYKAQSFGLHCPLACSLGPKWLFAVLCLPCSLSKT